MHIKAIQNVLDVGQLQGHWQMLCLQGKVGTIPSTNLD